MFHGKLTFLLPLLKDVSGVWFKAGFILTYIPGFCETSRVCLLSHWCCNMIYLKTFLDVKKNNLRPLHRVPSELASSKIDTCPTIIGIYTLAVIQRKKVASKRQAAASYGTWQLAACTTCRPHVYDETYTVKLVCFHPPSLDQMSRLKSFSFAQRKWRQGVLPLISEISKMTFKDRFYPIRANKLPITFLNVKTNIQIEKSSLVAPVTVRHSEGFEVHLRRPSRRWR